MLQFLLCCIASISASVIVFNYIQTPILNLQQFLGTSRWFCNPKVPANPPSPTPFLKYPGSAHVCSGLISFYISFCNNTRETILTIQLWIVHSLDYLQHYTLLILYCSNYLHYLNYNIYTTYSTLLTNTVTTLAKGPRIKEKNR